MVKSDVPQVAALLRKYLARFDIAQTFGKDEEVEHWFLSGQGKEVGDKRVEQVTWVYVVEVRTVSANKPLIPIDYSRTRLRI
jgi:glycylpeptide N-tetradecanoyltransferase